MSTGFPATEADLRAAHDFLFHHPRAFLGGAALDLRQLSAHLRSLSHWGASMSLIVADTHPWSPLGLRPERDHAWVIPEGRGRLAFCEEQQGTRAAMIWPDPLYPVGPLATRLLGAALTALPPRLLRPSGTGSARVLARCRRSSNFADALARIRA